MSCARGSIDLAFCRMCGAISNLAFDAARLEYDSSYDNSLHFSPIFQRYVQETASYLIQRYDLHGKDIIDVGCGKGEFLSLMCKLGNNRGVGFDPAFIAGRSDTTAGDGIVVVPDYYSERYADYAADLVICRQVLEHIPEPQPFLRRVRAAISKRRNTSVFFEVPNASFVFREGGIWDIIYEHCLYYSSGALKRLFSSCGFEVVAVCETFHGQYLCLEACLSDCVAGSPDLATADPLRHTLSEFADTYRGWLAHWQTVLQEHCRLGRRLAVWGAGAKGAMFLNAFPQFLQLACVVDVNPHKAGLHIPGTGQTVQSPECLIDYRPDVLVIMNPNYYEEIAGQVSALGLTPTLVSINGVDAGRPS